MGYTDYYDTLTKNKQKIDSLYKSLYYSRNKIFLLQEKVNVIEYCQNLSVTDFYRFIDCLAEYFFDKAPNLDESNLTKEQRADLAKFNEAADKSLNGKKSKDKSNLSRFIKETDCFNFTRYTYDKEDTDFDTEREEFYFSLSQSFSKISCNDIYTELEKLLRQTKTEIKDEKITLQAVLDKLENSVNKAVTLFSAQDTECKKSFSDSEYQTLKFILDDVVEKLTHELKEITNYLVYEGLAK